jgi:hypothetical protein
MSANEAHAPDGLAQYGTCAMCGTTYDRYGNNPDPLGDHEARVCTECNERFVIPARMGMFTWEQVNALRRVFNP